MANTNNAVQKFKSHEIIEWHMLVWINHVVKECKQHLHEVCVNKMPFETRNLRMTWISRHGCVVEKGCVLKLPFSFDIPYVIYPNDENVLG